MRIQLFGMSHLIGLLQGIVADTSPECWSPISRKHAEQHRLPLRPEWSEVELSAALLTPASDFSPAFQACTLGSGTPAFICNPNLQQTLGNFLGGDGDDATLVSVLHGHEHSVLSLVQHPTPYDFVLPVNPDLPFAPGAKPISHDIVARQVKDAIAPTVQALALVRALWPDARLIHVLAPPPIESATHIQAQREAIVGECRRLGVSGSYLRLKYYLECQSQLTAALTPLNVAIVPAPPQTLTAEGFLAQPYWGDATHANSAYGQQAFGEILASIRAERPCN